jgi:hypothetical protein
MNNVSARTKSSRREELNESGTWILPIKMKELIVFKLSQTVIMECLIPTPRIE